MSNQISGRQSRAEAERRRTVRLLIGLAAVAVAFLTGLSGIQVAAGQEIVHTAEQSIRTEPDLGQVSVAELRRPAWDGLRASRTDAEWADLTGAVSDVDESGRRAVRARAAQRIDEDIWLPVARQTFTDQVENIDVAADPVNAGDAAVAVGWAHCVGAAANGNTAAHRALADAVLEYMDTHPPICDGEM